MRRRPRGPGGGLDTPNDLPDNSLRQAALGQMKDWSDAVEGEVAEVVGRRNPVALSRHRGIAPRRFVVCHGRSWAQ